MMLLPFSLGYAISRALMAEEKPGIFPNSINLSVPPSAALDVLGVAPSKASSPGSLHEFAAGLLSSFDADGRLKQGFAFSGSTRHWSLASRNLDYDSYFKSGKGRVWQQTQLSAAAVIGSGEDKAGRAALSVNVPLVDRTDWRFGWKDTDRTKEGTYAYVVDQYQKEVAEYFKGVAFMALTDDSEGLQLYGQLQSASASLTKLLKGELDSATEAKAKAALQQVVAAVAGFSAEDRKQTVVAKLTAGAQQLWELAVDAFNVLASDNDLQAKVLEKRMAKKVDAWTKELDERYWNRERLDIAGALTWFSPDAGSKGLGRDGSFAWLTYAFPLGAGQGTLMGKYFDRDRKWDANAKSYEELHGWTVGARFRGGSKTSGWFVEYLHSRSDNQLGKRVNDELVQIGIERQISESQWIQLSLGTGKVEGRPSRTLFGLNFAFDLSPKRVLGSRGER